MFLKALEEDVENAEMKEETRSNHTGNDNTETTGSHCGELVLKTKYLINLHRFYQKEVLGIHWSHCSPL